MLDLELPRWTIALMATIFWLIQHRLRHHVRTWALITLPATALHELAHAAIGLVTAARPTSFSLWPRRVGIAAWRLGYVGFTNLRWWNGGAVAMAPLTWLLVIVTLLRYVPAIPLRVPLWIAASLGVGLVWLWIAVAPGRTDWRLARECWPSAIVFLAAWASGLYTLLAALA